MQGPSESIYRKPDLNVVLAKMNSMTFRTRSLTSVTLSFTEAVKEKFKVRFLQRLHTHKGDATVIGVTDDGMLWFWLDHEQGISYWDNLIQDAPKYFKENRGVANPLQPEKLDYPDNLNSQILKIFGHSVQAIAELFSEDIWSDHFLSDLFNNLKLDLLDEKNLARTEEVLANLLVEKPNSVSDDLLKCLASLEQHFQSQMNAPQISLPELPLATLETQIQQQLQVFSTQFPEPSKLIAGTLEHSIHGNLLDMQRLLNELNAKALQLLEQNKYFVEIHAKTNDHYFKILNFMIDYFLDFKKTYSYDPRTFEAYATICNSLGRFIHDHGSILFSDSELIDLKDEGKEVKSNPTEQQKKNIKDMADKKFLSALIFFSLAGVDISDPRKKACYMHFAGAKGLPEMFNLETFSSEHPKEFIAMYDSLNQNELYTITLKIARQNDSFFAQFEEVQLLQMYLNALKKTGNQELADAQVMSLKLQLLFLLNNLINRIELNTNADDINSKLKNFIVGVFEFADKNYATDFDVMIRIAKLAVQIGANKHLSILKKIQQGEIAIQHNIGSEAYYAELLLTQSSARSDHQQALAIARSHLQQHDDLLLKKLLDLRKESCSVAITLAYLYVENDAFSNPSVLDDLESFLKVVEYLPEAQYLYFKVKYKRDGFTTANSYILARLTTAAELGFQPATDELQALANETDNPELMYRLGEIYYSGKGVSKNIKLAMEFFETSNKPAAKFMLAYIVLNKEITTDVNPVPALKRLLSDQNECVREEAKNYLNMLKGVDRFKTQATLALYDPKAYEVELKQKARAHFSQALMDDKDPQVLFVAQKSATSALLRFLFDNLTDEVKLLVLQEQINVIDNAKTMQQLNEVHQVLAMNGIDVESYGMKLKM